MRVVYYSQTCYLDHVLPQVRALSQLVDLTLLIEMSPELWSGSILEAPESLPSGIIPGDPVFKTCFPPSVRPYWQDCANFSLVVHDCPRTIHPGTWRVSHQAAQFIKSMNPDVLHLDNVSPRIVSAIPALRSIPLVLTIHDPKLHSGEFNWRSVIARWLTFRYTDRFMLHSKGIEGSLVSRYGISPTSVDIVPMGVLDIFREWAGETVPLRKYEHTVLFFGRLSAYKGIDVLFEAAPMVTEKVPNVRFIVAGRPVSGYQPPTPPVLPNNSIIEMRSQYITNTQLTELFDEASVVVCPYIDATQSGVVLTAYAFDVPVVATNTGGLPEYVKHSETGLLVPPKDASSLAEALVTILTDSRIRHDLEDGVKKIRDGILSWDTIGKQTLQVYERTLSG